MIGLPAPTAAVNNKLYGAKAALSSMINFVKLSLSVGLEPSREPG
jgi:hypothetical protein